MLVTLFPLHVRKFSSPKRARITIVILFFLVVIYSCTEVLQFGISSGKCDKLVINTYLDKRSGHWSLTALYSYIPTFVVLCCSLTTAIMIRRKAEATSEMTASDKVKKNATKATKVVLTVAFTYLILTLPASIYLPLNQSTVLRPMRMSLWKVFIYRICQILILINHSINFILYVLVSANFRKQIKGICQNGNQPTGN